MRNVLFVTGAALIFTLVAGCSDDNTSSSSSGGTSGSSGGTSGSSGGTSGSSSSSSSSFTCKLNGACYVCPSGDAVRKCATESPSSAGCTSASEDKCN